MNLTKSTIFLILCLSFVIGVFLGRFMNLMTIVFTAMVFIVVSAVGWRGKLSLLAGVCGLVAMIGAVRFHQTYLQNDIAQFYGQTVQATGVVVEEPDARLDKTYLTIGNLIIVDQNISSKILLSVKSFPEYHYGQRIKFNAKIQEPVEFETFSYKNYLSRFGIDAVAYWPAIEILDGKGGNIIKGSVLGIKNSFVANINRSLPEPQAAFIGGLLLGAKRSIPEEITEQFRVTGVSHIVAISGYNITVIAVGIAWTLGSLGLGKRFAFPLGVLAILSFIIMTGAQASIVRAGMMGILFLLATNLGRTYSINNILGFSASVMLLANPQVLHFDVGFQLSFLAFLGLVYLAPMIEPYLSRVPKLLRPFLLATLSAQIFTLPVLLYYFGLFSIVAPIVNVLVLIAVPPAMLTGFLTGLMGFVSIQVAVVIGATCWLFLTYILKLVEWFSAIPLASVDWSVGPLVVFLYYVILVYILWRYHRKKSSINLTSPWITGPGNF